MLDEEVQDADFVVLDLGQLSFDVVRDKVGAASLWGEGESLLKPRHLL